MGIIEQAQLSGFTFPLPVAALIAGFFAAVVMVLVLIFLQVALRTRISIPLILGNMILPNGSPRDKRTIGTTVHLAIGSLWGLVFGMLLIYDFLVDSLDLIANGMLFAFVLWLMMMAGVMPMMGKGLFGLKLNKRAWIFMLVAHLTYGAFLGFILPLIFLQ